MDCEKANVDHIRRAIEVFSWEKCFTNTSVNSKVYMFNKTIKNIMSNYIPHETIICNDRDPSWINKDIKQPALEIREKSRRQKIAVAMSEFISKSDDNFLDAFPTNFSLEYMKSIYRYSYAIHFKADWT